MSLSGRLSVNGRPSTSVFRTTAFRAKPRNTIADCVVPNKGSATKFSSKQRLGNLLRRFSSPNLYFGYYALLGWYVARLRVPNDELAFANELIVQEAQCER